mgnify:CR=1 FL=1
MNGGEFAFGRAFKGDLSDRFKSASVTACDGAQFRGAVAVGTDAGWIADYQDPETFLGISRKASGNNYSNYNSPKFEELMDKAAAAGGNPDERFKYLSEAEQVLVDDVGQIPLLYYSFHNIVSPKLHGFDDNVMDVHPTRFISKDE